LFTIAFISSRCSANSGTLFWLVNEAALAVMKGLQIRVVKQVNDPGPFYHGTRADFAIGDVLIPASEPTLFI
jgi:hypothetical protein